MINIKMNYDSKRPPRIKFKGNSNDLLNELMEINKYVLTFVLDNTPSSIKEKLDTIDNFTNFLNEKVKGKYEKGIKYGFDE